MRAQGHGGQGMALRAIAVFVALALSAPVQAAFDSADFNQNQAVRILRVTPTGEDVPAGRQIVIQFNRPMVPVGRMARNASELALSIQPEPGCEWRWLNTSALACQLGDDTALAPATEYRLTVNAEFAADDGTALGETYTHRFITERPLLERAHFITWMGPGSPVLRLQFNLPVTRESVLATISLRTEAGGEPVRLQAGEVTPGRQEGPGIFPLPGERSFILAKPMDADAQSGEARRYWQVMPVTPLPDDSAASLWSARGLVTPEGPLTGVRERRVVQFHTFPEFEFLGVRCESNDRDTIWHRPDEAGTPCSPLRSVYLAFSVPVLSEEVQAHGRFEPDLAGGRDDYDPWANQYLYSQLHSPYRPGQEYLVRFPELLQARQDYRVALDGALKDEFGRELGQSAEITFPTDARPPKLELMYDQAVIESQVENDVPLTVTNLDTVDLHFQGLNAAGAIEPTTQRLDIPAVPDVAFHTPMGLAELLGGGSGAIAGTMDPSPRPQEARWNQFQFFAQRTPWQVHFKLGHFNSLAWVTDLATGEPVADAEVSVYLGSYAELGPPRQPLAQGRTDADGLVRLAGSETLDPQLAYRWSNWHQERLFVYVQRGDDVALLPLEYGFATDAGSVSDWAVGEQRQRRYGHVRAWGTTAQGVYRVGDTIQYKLYVRNRNGRKLVPPPQGRYTLTIFDPTGKEADKRSGLALSEFGALAGEFTVNASAPVGWYSFYLEADYLEGGLQPLRVLVSDFTPAPFRVASELNGDLFRAGETLSVDTLARMHAGGPYADAKARVVVRLQPRALKVKTPALKEFYFQTLDGNRSPETLFTREGEVDAQGELRSEVPLNADSVLYGRLDVESAVSDDRGKYVAGFASAAFAGRDRYVGLRRDGWLLHEDEPAFVDAAVVDAAGEAVRDTPVQVKVEREEVTAARVKGAGNAFITRYNREWVAAASCELELEQASARCEFTPEAPGRYRITASVTDTQGRAHSSQLYQWAAGKGQVLWPETAGNRLEIEPEQESYGVGDTARYLVRNPFPGAEALVTVERYGVLTQWVQRLEGSTPIIEVPIEPDYLPGFYLSVVVNSPRVQAPPGEGGVDLGRPSFRMGYVTTQVVDPYKQIEATASAERDSYRPRERVKVNIHAQPAAGASDARIEVAVAVLDEAVFDLVQGGSRYFDPYQGFYRLEGLDLANYGLLTRLIGLQKFEKKGANAGGDGGDGADARQIDKYVAYWEPGLRVDAQGNAQIEFDAPDNLTGWRVLVIAATPGDRFGLGQGSFKVNRPTEIRPAMPNQVMQGDRFLAGFSVMNRTDKQRKLVVRWTVEGLAEGTLHETDLLFLRPYGRETVYLPVEPQDYGQLRFTVVAGDDSDQDALRHTLPVLQRKAPVTNATYGTTTKAELSEQIRYPSEILPNVGGLSVVLSPTVIGNVDGAFRYMYAYPYMCWEQKLSKGTMAAHYSALAGYLDPELQWPGAASLPAATLAQAANHQAPSGGMSYYTPREQYVSPYLSAYTALAFGWLREHGHEPPQAVESRLQDYLRRLLRQDEVPSFYSAGMTSTVRAVALAALAKEGEIDRGDLDRYRAHVPRMSLFGQAHYLQAALAVEGTEAIRREVTESILAHAVQSGGKFGFNEALDDGYTRILSTPLRTQCAVLSALVAMGETEQAELVADVPFKLVRAITQSRGNRDHWENTQENMFCMNALIDFARVYEPQAPRMQIVARLDEQRLGEVAFQSVRDAAATLEQPMRAEDAGQDRRVSLHKDGEGRYYYAVRLAFAPTAVQQEPINAGIDLRREYSVQRDGRWQLLRSPMRIRRGELVRVDLFVSLPTARHFVVVDDPVPGGLEPVNRDLANTSQVDADAGSYQAAGGSWYLQFNDWVGYSVNRWSFYHQELRHDAARFYSDYLPPGNYHLSYTAQAIAEGSFTVLPTHSEEMYDPDVFGKSAPALLEVEGE